MTYLRQGNYDTEEKIRFTNTAFQTFKLSWRGQNIWYILKVKLIRSLRVRVLSNKFAEDYTHVFSFASEIEEVSIDLLSCFFCDFEPLDG